MSFTPVTSGCLQFVSTVWSVWAMTAGYDCCIGHLRDEFPLTGVQTSSDPPPYLASALSPNLPPAVAYPRIAFCTGNSARADLRDWKRRFLRLRLISLHSSFYT
jgi:hypothetical protein